MFRTGRNQNFPGVSVQETRTVLRALQLGWICCSWLAVPVLLYLNVLVWRGSWAGPPWLAAWLEKNRSPRLTVFQECSQWEGAIPPFENWGAIPQDVRLVSLIFLKRNLVFPILLFSSISLHWSLRKAFLSLLAILWDSAFRCLYLFFSPLLFASLLFTAICKASSDNHFAFLHFFSMGMVLIPVSCTMSRTSIHSSSGTLSIRSRPLSLILTSTV